MGRFATTVALYEELRPPYPAEFFRNVAQRLSLGKRQALIDLGTGPGLLALGFAPHVGRVVGVDPEPAMTAAARKAAVRASQALTLIESKAEDLAADIGSFDVVTIGRTFSSSSPGVLGDRTDAMLRDVEQRLLPLSCDGSVSEAVVAAAQVLRR